jgi:hypothetical protein
MENLKEVLLMNCEATLIAANDNSFNERTLFSSKSAAKYLDRSSAAWVQDRHRNPNHPIFYRLNGRVIYKRSDLDNWIDTQWQQIGGAA